MKKKCPHHGLTIINTKHFCPKCEDDLQKISDNLNAFFSGITIEIGKDGEPKVTRKK